MIKVIFFIFSLFLYSNAYSESTVKAGDSLIWDSENKSYTATGSVEFSNDTFIAFSEKMIALLTLTQDEANAGVSLHDLSASCSKGGTKDTNSGNIYGTYTPGEKVAASDMKYRKWGAILNSKDYMNCKGTKETKKFQIFKLSPTWGSGDVTNENITDDVMYIGKVQIKLNDGKKTNFLYFQADYRLKGLNENEGSGNQDGDPLNAQQQDGG